MMGETGTAARWSDARVQRWYDAQPWLIGANYVPANAGNQFDMWAGSFDPPRIDRELGWAAGLGMNAMRVFLIHTLWNVDPAGFAARIDTFLDIAAKHGIRPLFVLFDSCWGPDPEAGPSTPLLPGVHNSAWLQSPGERVLADPSRWPQLRAYVEGVVGRYANDRRVLGWDVWNEPCNPGNPHRPNPDYETKSGAVEQLLPQVYAWARAQNPIQPLTSGLWQHEDWSPGAPLTAIETIQIEQSDFLSFHDYGDSDQFLRRLGQLRGYGRPVICTEWLARTTGSTIEAILPAARREHVGMFNWGLVEGKTQTIYPWDSWVSPYPAQPDRWFHDLLRADGTPYCAVEAAMIKALATMETAKAA